MTYKALVYFEDLQDGRHPYEVGDTFPRDGFTPSPERIAELCGDANKRGRAVIEAVEDKRKVADPEPEPEIMNEPVTVQEFSAPRSKRGRKRKETD